MAWNAQSGIYLLTRPPDRNATPALSPVFCGRLDRAMKAPKKPKFIRLVTLWWLKKERLRAEAPKPLI